MRSKQRHGKNEDPPILLTLIVLWSNLIVLGGGRFAPKTFLVFLLLNSKAKLILCLSCDFCNV